MKSLTIQIRDEDFARLQAGAGKSRVYDTPETLAAFAVDVGLFSLEAINFDVVGTLVGDLSIPRITA